MTARKEESCEKEGILEEILRSVRLIGRNVEQMLDRFDEYAEDSNHGCDDELKKENLYNNGDY